MWRLCVCIWRPPPRGGVPCMCYTGQLVWRSQQEVDELGFSILFDVNGQWFRAAILMDSSVCFFVVQRCSKQVSFHVYSCLANLAAFLHRHTEASLPRLNIPLCHRHHHHPTHTPPAPCSCVGLNVSSHWELKRALLFIKGLQSFPIVSNSITLAPHFSKTDR